jgi:hypothetical protein
MYLYVLYTLGYWFTLLLRMPYASVGLAHGKVVFHALVHLLSMLDTPTGSAACEGKMI